MFWNQGERERERERERAGEKKREWELARMFLNEGDKENKRKRDKDSGHVCGGEKQEKKKWMMKVKWRKEK